MASADDSAARPGSCRKPPSLLYVKSGKERTLLAFAFVVRWELTTFTVEAVDTPLRMDSAADCLCFAQESFGALHQMLAKLNDSARAAAWAEVGTALAEFEDADGFTGPCQTLVAAATK